MTIAPRKALRPTIERLEGRCLPTNLPPGFVDAPVASGLSTPTAMEFTPDGRLVAAEQGGTLRVIRGGVLLPTPMLTLGVDDVGERGLLGIAFDPDFAANNYFYVYYTTATAPIHNRVSRFTADGDVAVPGSEDVLLDLPPLSSATNHNGGAIHFGADGKLYIGVGDNADGANSQSLATPLGKLLRIDADGTIPADNPFYNQTTGINRAIWALGLRNPFTFAVQPGTGRIFIDDVGLSTWEEIDVGIPGANYGWPITEGPTNDPRFVGPIFAYGHGAGDSLGVAIVGGTFYDPPVAQFPGSYDGQYFFSDLANGWIRTYNPADGSVGLFADGLPSLQVDLKVGPDGSLYYLNQNGGDGIVDRISYARPQPTPSLTLFRPPTAEWLSVGPTIGTTIVPFGLPTDIPLRGDFDGDGRPDLAVFRPATATWYVLLSGGGAIVRQFGAAGDIPVPADYDGDGRTDLAVYRPATAQWFLLGSSAGPRAQQFGAPGLDRPVPADYDGDQQTDLAVYRPTTATWYLLQTAAGPRVQQFGAPGLDQPVPADYDGDGKADLAVFRPTDATWYLLQTTAGPRGLQFGIPGDIPAPADYDGDGRIDVGVYRPSDATWYLLQTTAGPEAYPFGTPDVDVPVDVPLAYRYGGPDAAPSVREALAPAPSTHANTSPPAPGPVPANWTTWLAPPADPPPSTMPDPAGSRRPGPVTVPRVLRAPGPNLAVAARIGMTG